MNVFNPIGPILILATITISGGGMLAFAVVLHFVLMVSSSPLSPHGRRVNHIPLRSITRSPASPVQPIDFPPGSEELWSDAMWAPCLRETDGVRGILRRVPDWN